MENYIKKIGEIEFKDMTISVFYDKHTHEDSVSCSWGCRNPSSFYQGPMFVNNFGKISYPEDAIIPEKTEEDRQIIPKFIICGLETMTDRFKKQTLIYLDINYEYKNRNN